MKNYLPQVYSTKEKHLISISIYKYLTIYALLFHKTTITLEGRNRSRKTFLGYIVFIINTSFCRWTCEKVCAVFLRLLFSLYYNILILYEGTLYCNDVQGQRMQYDYTWLTHKSNGSG